MKKVLALLLAALLIASLCTACGNNGGTETTKAAENTTEKKDDTKATTAEKKDATTEATTESAEKVVVRFSYPNWVTPTEDGLLDVQNKINEYLDQKGENYHIELANYALSEYSNQMDMALLAGSQVDLFFASSYSMAVSGNKLLALDEYLDDELKDAVELMGEKFIEANRLNDHIYGIPCYKGQVTIWYWTPRKDIFDAAGLDPTEDYTVNTVEKLTYAFKKCQEVEPDVPVLAARNGGITGGSYRGTVLDSVLAGREHYQFTSVSSGAVTFGNSTEIVDYYESDMFNEVVATAREWNLAGYLPQDASLATEDYDIQADQAQGRFVAYAYDVASVEERTANKTYPLYAIPLSEVVFTSNFINWGIAYNCEHPAEAAKFLNLLYCDEYVLNLIIYGIEDVGYVVSDETTAVKSIVWPEGLGPDTVPYTAYNDCGILGNQFIMYALKGSTNASDIPFMADHMKNAFYSPLFGFTLNSDSISNEISAVTNVINQYMPGIACGEFDPDQYVPEFKNALSDAGYDTILTEVQKQVDEWAKTAK